MKIALAISSLLCAVAAPAIAEDEGEIAGGVVEQAFAQCIHDNDPALLIAIRDAGSEQEFVDAIERRATICDLQADKLSMGRFFSAVSALIGPPEYDDPEENDPEDQTDA